MTSPQTPNLREAAKAVVEHAEPDESFEGEFIDYLVPFEHVETLRAALATPVPDLDVERLARALETVLAPIVARAGVILAPGSTSLAAQLATEYTRPSAQGA